MTRIEAAEWFHANRHSFGMSKAGKASLQRAYAKLRCDQRGGHMLRAGRCAYCGWIDETVLLPDLQEAADEQEKQTP